MQSKQVSRKEIRFLIYLCDRDVSFSTSSAPLLSPAKTAGEMFAETISNILCALEQSTEGTMKERQKLAKQLLNTGVDLKFLLHIFEQQNKVGMMTAFLDFKMEPDLVQECLHVACKHLMGAVAEALYERGGEVLQEKEGITPYQLALDGNCVHFLQFVAERNEEVKKKLCEEISLDEAIKKGYVSVIDHHVNITDLKHVQNKVKEEYDNNRIKVPSVYGYLSDADICLLIEEHFKNKEFKKMNTLMKHCNQHLSKLPQISAAKCCTHNQLELLRYLVKNGMQLDKQGRREMLTLAIDSGKKDFVEVFIQGVDLEHEDENGRTVFVHACEKGNEDVIILVLGRGPNINYAGSTGNPPLTIISEKGLTNAVIRLLSRPQIRIDLKNKTRFTALQLSIMKKHPEIALMLLKHGADPNEAGNHKPPIQLAYASAQFHLVNALHRQGANIKKLLQIVDLDSLIEIGSTDLVEIFLKENKSSKFSLKAMKKVVQTLLKETKSSKFNLKSMKRAVKLKLNKEFIQLVLQHSDDLNKAEQKELLLTACTAGCATNLEILIQHFNKLMWNENFISDMLKQSAENLHGDCVAVLDYYAGIQYSDEHPIPSGWCSPKNAVSSEPILQAFVKSEKDCMMIGEAIMHAIKQANAKNLKVLLEKKKVSSESIKNNYGVNALKEATFRQNSEIVTLLLEHDISPPNSTDENKISAIYIAAGSQHYEIASILLDRGAQVDCDDIPHNLRPLWIASLDGCHQLVELLLLHGANTNLMFEGKSLLDTAHSMGHHEVVRQLLEHWEPDPSCPVNISFDTACSCGYSKLALSQYNPMFNVLNNITIACQNGFQEIAEALQEKIFHNQQQQCQNIISQHFPQNEASNSSPSQEEQTDLWHLLRGNEKEKILQEIHNNTDPNITNDAGVFFLHSCIRYMPDRIVNAILNSPRFNVNHRNIYGQTISHCCAVNDRKWLKIFIERGSDLRAQDIFKRTLLHEISFRPDDMNQDIINEAMIEKLVESNDMRDVKQQTSLHIAVLQKDSRKVKVLLERNSDPNAKDINDRTPYDLARLVGHEDVLNLFHEEIQQMQKQNKHTVYHLHNNMKPRAIKEIVQYLDMDLTKYFKSSLEPLLLCARGITFKQQRDQFLNDIKDFLVSLAKEVEKMNPLFAFKPVLSGSCRENTKIEKLDEADVLCTLTHKVWKNIAIQQWKENDFTYLKVQICGESMKELSGSNVHVEGNLTVQGLLGHMYQLIHQALPAALQQCKNIFLIDVQSVLLNSCSITPLNLVWGAPGEWQEFSLDVVPAIPVPEIHAIKHTIEWADLVHTVYVVPKWTAQLIDEAYEAYAYQLCFTHFECDMFETMPISFKFAYMTIKALLHTSLTIDDYHVKNYISSYMAKTKTFECFSETPEFANMRHNRSRKCEDAMKTNEYDIPLDQPAPELPDIYEIQNTTDKILAKLQASLEKKNQRSFFIRGCNLLAHRIYSEDFRPLIYVLLARVRVSNERQIWKRLAQELAKQQSDVLEEERKYLLDMGLEPNFSKFSACRIFPFH